MKKGIKIVLIVFCLLILFFCLSGFAMVGSFSVAAPLEQQAHYQFVSNLYAIGSLSSFFLLVYLIFFTKVSKRKSLVIFLKYQNKI